MESSEPSDNRRIAAALGHPLRRQILVHLLEGAAADPERLAAAVGAPLGRVRYHLGVLAEAGVAVATTLPAGVVRDSPGRVPRSV